MPHEILREAYFCTAGTIGNIVPLAEGVRGKTCRQAAWV